MVYNRIDISDEVCTLKLSRLLVMVTALFVLLLASACALITAPPAGGTVHAPLVPGPVLNGTSWKLAEFVDAGGVLTTVPESVEVTLAFADGNAAGSGGCNRYSAPYTVDGQNGLTFGPAVSTKMACEGPGSEVEQAYFAVLTSVAGFETAPGTLTLWDADRNVVATFTEVVPLPLMGATWNATSVNTGRQGVETLVEGTTVTAVFGEDGTLSGQACNNYAAAYTVDGASITIEMGMSTMMACTEPGVMEQEQAYLMMLPQAATYRIDGDRMELRTTDGALIASYVAER